MLTKNQQLGKQRVPKLRFVGFEHVWEEKSLAEVAKIITGQTPPTVNRDFYGGDYLFVSPVDFDGQRYITETKTTCTRAGFDKVRKVEKGSVLFVCIGSTIGKIAQAKKDCITNQQINSLTSNNGNSNDFIYFNLLNKSPKIKLLAGKQAVPMINKSDFSKIKSMFTSIEEQQKIASFLGLADELIDNLKEEKENLELYKKGMTQKIFSQQIRFKEFNGDVFQEWENKKLEDICDVKGGKRIPLGYSLQIENNGFPYITVSDMENNSVSVEKIKYVPELVVEQIKNYTISTKDIFVSVAGTLGLIGIIPKELEGANLTENADKLTNLKCDQKFLFYYLQNGTLEKLISSVKTSNAQPKLAIYALKTLEIKLPSFSEQQKIADFLTSVDKVIESKQQQISQAEQWKKGLMQGLFV